MKTVEFTEKSYADILEMKNFFTIKIRFITNKEVLSYLNDPKHKGALNKKFNPRVWDYEPEFTFSTFLPLIINSVWNEQDSGEVNFIT